MKKIISILGIVLIIHGCALDMNKYLVNSLGRDYDFGSIDRNRFGIAFYAELHTIDMEDALKQYESDSLNPRLAYKFSFLNPTLPKITIHSFSFTKINGDPIPTIFYYQSDTGYVIIKSLPVTFSEKDSLLVSISGLRVIAECSQSYHQTKDVYINFDVQIDSVRVDTSILYSRKLFTDWRPKF